MSIKSMAKRVGLGVASLGLVAGGAALTAAPAEAFIWDAACNSSASDEFIGVGYIYQSGDNFGNGELLGDGVCYYNYFSDGTNLRVNTDPTGSGTYGVDTDSYKIGWIDHGYGPCHVGETMVSNPDDSYENPGFRYMVATNSSCS